MGPTGITLNTKGFAKEMGNFLRKVEEKNQLSLKETAEEVAALQYRILQENVINWTGNLANSISIDLKKDNAVIGPNFTKAPYAGWIEDGRGKISNFDGYHYIKDSVLNSQIPFINRIKANLK